MPSRRNSIELTGAEIRAFLDSRKTLIIVSNGKDGYPHPMPMWFYVDDEDCLYCTTFGKSQKILNWKRDPKASLLVESGTEYAQLKGVVIYARAEIIEDLDTAIDTLVKINTRGATIDAAQRQALTAAVSKTASKRAVIKFHPERYVSWDHSKLGGRY
jgi:nitroimidazol reductase NimA-like FMN-containing flavoprotein (pyridoxamine 5'-phosphate oxidase superfamily)